MAEINEILTHLIDREAELAEIAAAASELVAEARQAFEVQEERAARIAADLEAIRQSISAHRLALAA